MNILSIDTTTPWGSVAVLRDGAVVAEQRLYEEKGHSRGLFVAVDFLTRAAGIAVADVDAFVAAVGPGSFTGVRVGVSAVQGLALAAARPCLGLSTLLGLAAKMCGSAAVLVPLIDGYRDQVYGAAYDAELRPLIDPVAAPLGDLLARLSGPAAFLGSGAAQHRDAIAQAYPGAVFPSCSSFIAGILGRLAYPRFLAGEGGPAASLSPLYLRAPDIRTAAAKV